MRRAHTDVGTMAMNEPMASNEELPSHLVGDANRIYWVTSDSVRAMEKNDTMPTTLVSHPGDIGGGGIVVDDHYVYWIEYDDVAMTTSVWKSNKYDNDGNEYALIEDVGGLPTSIAQDCDHVFVSIAQGLILRVTK